METYFCRDSAGGSERKRKWSAELSYDALNRLATLQENNTGTTTYGYDNAGNLQSATYPNGVVHSYSYDTRNRLTTLGVAKAAQRTLWTVWLCCRTL